MGDHSRSINTMFNTGTVVGGARTFSAPASRPSLCLPSPGRLRKAFLTYRIGGSDRSGQPRFERRKLAFNDMEQRIFRHLYFDPSTKYRALVNNKNDNAEPTRLDRRPPCKIW